MEEQRLVYDLNHDSIVMDIGSYIGQFSRKIYDRYHCKLFCYEPIREFFQRSLDGHLKGIPVRVFNYAIGIQDCEISISKCADRSSVVIPIGDVRETIKMKTMQSAMQEANIKLVDLIKINIEGVEYDLLDKLYEDGLIILFKDIQVQFHQIPGWETRYQKISDALSKTHAITYRYPMLWENWHRKS